LKTVVRLLFRSWLWGWVALYLVGCASGAAPLADVVSAVVTEKWGASDALVLAAKPNPLYRYLRVEVVGRAPALLVLGYVDPHPQGEIEVWYSAQREVIKTQNGRIVGTSGLELDWRAVRFPSPLPAWTEVLPQGGIYQRLRDEMPGHRYAITDQIELKPWVGTPPIALPVALAGEQASTRYRWFSEATLSSRGSPLPPSWFAWGLHRGQPAVVYSEQCLSATFCLKLQRWPVQESSS
jgi:hypothetical protein